MVPRAARRRDRDPGRTRPTSGRFVAPFRHRRSERRHLSDGCPRRRRGSLRGAARCARGRRWETGAATSRSSVTGYEHRDRDGRWSRSATTVRTGRWRWWWSRGIPGEQEPAAPLASPVEVAGKRPLVHRVAASRRGPVAAARREPVGSASPRRASGEACSVGAECLTGWDCADGVCCESECQMSCRSCALPSSEGSVARWRRDPRSPWKVQRQGSDELSDERPLRRRRRLCGVPGRHPLRPRRLCGEGYRGGPGAHLRWSRQMRGPAHPQVPGGVPLCRWRLFLAPRAQWRRLMGDDVRKSTPARLTEHAVGGMVGPYRLVRQIGQGATGTVFEVEQVRIGRRAAMKDRPSGRGARWDVRTTLHGSAGGESDRAPRHRREESPTCSSRRRARRGHALVMELLEGRSLADLVSKQEPLSSTRLLPILVQVCDALAAVHAAGFVHRNLKPENVFLVRRESTRRSSSCSTSGWSRPRARTSHRRERRSRASSWARRRTPLLSRRPQEGGPANRHLRGGGHALRAPHRSASVRGRKCRRRAHEQITEAPPHLPRHLLMTDMGRAFDAIGQARRGFRRESPLCVAARENVSPARRRRSPRGGSRDELDGTRASPSAEPSAVDRAGLHWPSGSSRF